MKQGGVYKNWSTGLGSEDINMCEIIYYIWKSGWVLVLGLLGLVHGGLVRVQMEAEE